MNWIIFIIKKIFIEENIEWKAAFLRTDKYGAPMMTRRINGVRTYREMTDAEREDYFSAKAW